MFVMPAAAQNEKPMLEMNILYGNFNGTVQADQDNIVYMEVRNSGNITLNNIVFSYLAPKGWTVIFAPASLATLAPGSYQNIELNIRPVYTGNRNNNLTLVAQSNETRQIISVYTQLESTNRMWLWIGSGVAVIAVAVFIFLYRRLNRN